MKPNFTEFYKFRTQIISLADRLREEETIPSNELDENVVDIAHAAINALYEAMKTYAAFVDLPTIYPLFDKFCEEYYNGE